MNSRQHLGVDALIDKPPKQLSLEGIANSFNNSIKSLGALTSDISHNHVEFGSNNATWDDKQASSLEGRETITNKFLSLVIGFEEEEEVPHNQVNISATAMRDEVDPHRCESLTAEIDHKLQSVYPIVTSNHASTLSDLD
eukprot:CAMPEP_0194254616 /NCGR_PEP_ID=MMETSP0158-20130606/32599_1 /TAXON_ID=33649 /ORGANISM="Thalassionema nitzschioides, Strain L26-B" /LENGTH=139 /DNA_ID=CAMNT_0038992721 /DNA_START=49 /DNA_END=465 /DNA_ORIENTATION=+